MTPTLGILGAILGGIILLAGAIKALPTVWSFVKAVGRAPIVLERIHEEFSPNGGGSMRDAIDRQGDALAGVLEWQAEHAADDVARLADLAQHDAEMTEYLHRRVHDLLNALTPVVSWAPLHDRRLARIEEALRLSAEASEVVAADLVEAKAVVEGVAEDLAHERDVLHPPDSAG